MTQRCENAPMTASDGNTGVLFSGAVVFTGGDWGGRFGVMTREDKPANVVVG